ncbi:MAG: glycosyltransferase [Coriobacteriales bacterium]|jgi:glycosyltransferase involved in cell wall biosynthesis|nr:glycosyltransferase [Coriobacteriales bacterium]
MAVSVALAARNGSAYLAEQVASILPQLKSGDELVISVDPSTDDTLGLATQLASQTSLITVLDGPGQGIASNFQNALTACTGTHIFLSDHDDLWFPTKVSDVLEAFKATGAALILHDAEVVDATLNTIAPSFFKQRGSRPGYTRNILKNSYIGCCMAFCSSLKPLILPFPSTIPMHDQWIGLIAEKHGGTYFLNKPLVKYRRHAQNATTATHASLSQMLTWRRDLITQLQSRKQYPKDLKGQSHA